MQVRDCHVAVQGRYPLHPSNWHTNTVVAAANVFVAGHSARRLGCPGIGHVADSGSEIPIQKPGHYVAVLSLENLR
jgi:hypothetical protein